MNAPDIKTVAMEAARLYYVSGDRAGAMVLADRVQSSTDKAGRALFADTYSQHAAALRHCEAVSA